MLKSILLLGLIVFVTFSGCSGGGGDSSSGATYQDSSIKTAYFSDSRVQGITFTCADINGTTDKDGAFKYSTSCNEITFSLGEVILGSISRHVCDNKTVVYPADIFGLDRNETNSTAVTNVLQFLQSLDEDKNPFNGIAISQRTVDKLLNVEFDFRDMNTTESEVKNLVVSKIGKKFRLRKHAISYYEDTLRKDLNLSLRTTRPAPAIALDVPASTKEDSVVVIINGLVGSKILLDGVNTTQIFDVNNSATITLDTSGLDGELDFNITISDENNVISDALIITISKDTTAPTFMPLVDKVNIDENSKFVLDLNATDTHLISFSIAGNDVTYFDINNSTGEINFKTAPDYESKSSFDIIVVASDSAQNEASMNLRVSINPLNDETPLIISNSRSIDEENHFVMLLEATDADKDTAQIFSYSIVGGADSAKFNLSSDGNLSFITAPDYDLIDDNNSDAIYELSIQVSDGIHLSSKELQITIDPINDIAPIIFAPPALSVDENFDASFVDLNHTDADLGIEQLFTYSLGGTDKASFSINATSGAISFINAPDYEVKESYKISVAVSDGINSSNTLDINISINHLNDIAPVITTEDVSINENLNLVTTVSSTDADKDESQTFNYTLLGTDAGKFNIDTLSGILTLKSPSDYESKQSYSLTLSVNDGINTTTKAITVYVNHSNDELPYVTDVTLSSNINENTPISTVIIDASHSDRDIDEVQDFSYVLGGVDADIFNFNATEGSVTFKATPDYENPVDSDRNNLYNLTIRTNDGVNLGPVSQLAVRLNNLDDVPTPTAFNGIIRGSVNYGHFVANALVLLQDRNGGYLQVFTDANGNYSFSVTSSFSGPFLIKSFLPTGEVLYSYNDGEHEVTNITPVTTLIVRNFLVELGVSTTSMSELFDNYSTYYTTYSDVFSVKFTAAYNTVSAYFASSLVSIRLSGFNHIYNTFYSYGFDYDALLAEANMLVSNNTIIIRYKDNVYSVANGVDYSGNINVSGVVRDASGILVTNATVVVRYNGTSFSRTTNSSGVYTLSIPKYLNYDLAITYNNRTVNYYGLSTFLDENSTDTTELSVEEAKFVNDGNSTITGKVINISNTALNVANATIKVREGYNNQTSEVVKTITTDTNGAFSVELENGNYTFEYTKASWTTKYETVYVNNDTILSDVEIGLISDVAGVSTLSVDMLALSDSGISDSDNITNDTTPTIVSDANATLLVKNAAFTTVQEITMTQANNLTVTLDSLSDGLYTIVGVDSQGNATGFTLLSFTIDTTTVATPTINLHSSTDSGVSNSDNITNSNPLQLRGTAEVNSTITLKDGNTTLDEIIVDENGDYIEYVYSYAYYTNYNNRIQLDEGEYNLTVIATDIAGNTQVSDILDLVIDRTGAPLTTIDLNASSDSGRSSTDNYTNDTTPTFTTDQNVSLDVKDSSGTIVQTLFSGYLNNYTVTLSSLSDGVYKITSGDENNNSDTAGNILNYSYTNFTIDTVTNALTLDLYSYDDRGISNSDNITNDNSIRIDTGAEYNSFVTIYDGIMDLGSGTAYNNSYDIYLTNLLDGNYTLSATVVDQAGNENTTTATLDIEIDTVGERASTIVLDGDSDSGYSQIDNITNDTTPTFSTSLEVTLRMVLESNSSLVQEVDTTILPSGMYTATFAPLADGIYRIESGINGTDTAGNSLGYSSLRITIDTTISTPSIDLDILSDSGDSDSDNITNDNTPTITGSADAYSKIIIKDTLVDLKTINARYYSYSDYENGAYSFSYGAYNVTLSELNDGNHTLNVTAYDVAGNSATAILEVEIDTVGVPSIQMSIDGVNGKSIEDIESVNEKLDLLTNKYTLGYSDLTTSSWGDAGDDMYDGGNKLYIDNVLQEIWETTNSSDNNSASFGNYTFRTNTSSTVLYVENFNGSEFKISGNTGADGNGDVEFGEIVNSHGLKVFYHQISNANDPSINHIILTDAINPSFTASTNSDDDGFVLSNIEADSHIVYILFAGINGYHYSSEDFNSIIEDIGIIATNDTTPTVITDANVTLTIKTEDNSTLQVITTVLNDNNYTATLDTLVDGNYYAETGDKGRDIAGNPLSYSKMNFTIDTVISTPTLDLNSSSDSGISDSDNVTNDANPLFSGTGEAGAIIEIKDSFDTVLGTTRVYPDGNYSVYLSDLPDANYTLNAVATDFAGNSKTTTLNVVIDTFGDTLIDISMESTSDTGNSNSDQITGDTTPTLVTDRESTLTLLDELNITVQTVNTSTMSVTLGTLADGIYTVEGGDKGTDIAGNPLSYNTTVIQVDTTAPSLTSPTELDNNSTITPNSLHVYNTATSDASDVTYTLSGTDAGYFTIDTLTGIITLSDITTSAQTYNVIVTATDVVGNSDSYDITITPQVIVPLISAKITQISSAVAAYGEYVVIGDKNNDNVANDAGIVNVYKKDLDGSLSLFRTLTASNATSYDYFGQSVAIYGNYIVVGASGINSSYLYKINADSTISELSILTDEDNSASNFGYSLAIDGEYIVVGAYSTYGSSSSEGAVYLYKINNDDTTTQMTTIKAADAQGYDYFGYSLDISGDKIVIGAYGVDGIETDIGAAYVYQIETNATVTELEKVITSDGAYANKFGYSVSISGDKIVIGAYQNTPISSATYAGAAYLFNIDNMNNVNQIAKLTASDLDYNFDYFSFGESVSIDESYITITSSRNASGAVYLYKIDNEDSVTELVKLSASDNAIASTFGNIVSVNGSNIVIKSNDAVYLFDIFADRPYIPSITKEVSFNESSKTDIYTIPLITNIDSSDIIMTLSGDDADKFTVSDNVIRSNSALDFELPTDADAENNYTITLRLEDANSRVNSYDMTVVVKDTVYFEDVKLKANDADNSDNLGSAIAIEGNYVVVGAKDEDANGEYDAGSAYLYVKGIDSVMTQVSKLTASDGSSSDYFGQSISLSGSYIIVGASQGNGIVDNTGTAYLYKINSDSSTTQVAKLFADDGASNDQFGFSVAISGDYISIGSLYSDANGTKSGAVYLFKKDSNDNVTQIKKFSASGIDSYDYFGHSIAMDGTSIVVGAYQKNTYAYLFDIDNDDSVTEVAAFTTTDSKSKFGFDVDISGDYIVVGNYGRDNAYLFKRALDNSISQVAKFEVTSPSNFGNAVAISGDTIVIGDNGKNSVTIFAKDASDSIVQMQTIVKEQYSNFGSLVDIDTINIGISAPKDDESFSDSGAAYIFVKDTNQ